MNSSSKSNGVQCMFEVTFTRHVNGLPDKVLPRPKTQEEVGNLRPLARMMGYREISTCIVEVVGNIPALRAPAA